jgi:hypothetical protein
MDVQTVQTAVAEHFSQRDTDSLQTENNIGDRTKELERRAIILMLSGGALMLLMVIGFLIALGLSRILHFDIKSFGVVAPWIVAVALILMGIAIGIGVYSKFANESRAAKNNKLQESKSRVLSESTIEPIQSVTEHTTRKLETVPGAKKRVTAETGP